MGRKRKFTTDELEQAIHIYNGNVEAIAEHLGCEPNTVYLHIRKSETTQELIRSKKQLQRQQDLNRIKNKTFREYARVENALEEYIKSIEDNLKKHSLSIKTIKHQHSRFEAEGIIHLSDLHFNEIVDDVLGNKYDFTIASKRLYKHACRAITIFSAHGIKNILIALTGDILNSDRRLDELLANATNRSKATLLSIDLLQQMILHLNKHFNITVASITGNESRVGKDVGWINDIATDNYDFVIHEMLARLFKGKKGVTFLSGDPMELIVEVGGSNILLIHGHSSFAKNPSRGIPQLRAKYASQDVNIHYVIFGHIHEAYISDTYARSASLVGGNAYSDKALNLTSKASQNLYICHKDGGIDGFKIDLQSVENIESPYIINERLEAYNAKSASKTKQQTVIFQVTV